MRLIAGLDVLKEIYIFCPLPGFGPLTIQPLVYLPCRMSVEYRIGEDTVEVVVDEFELDTNQYRL